jgi:hypothetical protein
MFDVRREALLLRGERYTALLVLMSIPTKEFGPRAARVRVFKSSIKSNDKR